MFRPSANSSTQTTSKRFYSSSGHTYSTDEIIGYILQQRTFPAIFCDFKASPNSTYSSLNMFTVSDVIQLLMFPHIRAVVLNNEAFIKLYELSLDIREQTLTHMKALAETTVCLENLNIALNPALLGEKLTVPLMNLHNHLFQKTKAAARERTALVTITSPQGPLKNYWYGRSFNFIEDLQALMFKHHCSAGFNACLRGLYASFMSYKLYEQAISELAPTETLRMFRHPHLHHQRTNMIWSLPPEIETDLIEVDLKNPAKRQKSA